MRHLFCPECGRKVIEASIRCKQYRRIRTLPVDSETLNMLRELITGHLGNEFVFGISRHRAWQIVRDCARKANTPEIINPDTGKVRGVSPHRLRDVFAIHAVKIDDTGDGLRLLQEHLGHTSFNTTAKYRKVAGEEHRAWYERLWRDKPA
jgi:integrase/recombinase XerD